MKTRIFTCGDIVINQYKEQFICPKLNELINNVDIAICNFEAPLKSKGKAIPKAGPHVFQDKKALHALKTNGFTHLALANNHIFDFGSKGLEKTLDQARQLKLTTFGAGLNWDEAYGLKTTLINNQTFGFLAFCESEFGAMTEKDGYGAYAYINHYQVNQLVEQAKSKVDFLLVSVHAGVEEISLPLPEWRNRYKELCDYGADVIIGHHPHVPQGWETYKGKPIFYSLGNFYFDIGKYKSSENCSYSVVLNFDDNKNLDFEIITHKQAEGKVSIIDDIKFNNKLDNLCTKLGANYEEEINKIVVELYEKRYIPAYQRAIKGFSSDMSAFKIFRRRLANIIFRRKNLAQRELLLLHNIRIESHRYLTQRALHLIYEKTDKYKK
jgi:poly-gamma-glutamate synthesis protein (capsule biosynthesis protein)